jgi:hypothetical protein
MNRVFRFWYSSLSLPSGLKLGGASGHGSPTTSALCNVGSLRESEWLDINAKLASAAHHRHLLQTSRYPAHNATCIYHIYRYNKRLEDRIAPLHVRSKVFSSKISYIKMSTAARRRLMRDFKVCQSPQSQVHLFDWTKSLSSPPSRSPSTSLPLTVTSACKQIPLLASQHLPSPTMS